MSSGLSVKSKRTTTTTKNRLFLFYSKVKIENFIKSAHSLPAFYEGFMFRQKIFLILRNKGIYFGKTKLLSVILDICK